MTMDALVKWMAVGLAAIAIAGCSGGSGEYKPKPPKPVKVEEIKPDEGRLLFPAKVGNQWTYSIESKQSIAGQQSTKTDELRLTVIKVEPAGNGQRVTIQAATNGENTDKQSWLIDNRGIFQEWVMNANTRFSPAQPSVMFPLSPGPNFVWKGSGPTVVGKLGPQQYKGTLLATQLVDTDMGQFSAVCVESDGTFTVEKIKGQSKTTTFWAKGVGLVRFRQETAFMSGNALVQGVQLVKLKTYTLK